MAQATRRGILAVVTAIVLLALGAGVGVVLGDALGIRTEPSAQMTPAAPVAPASATVVLPPEFTEVEAPDTERMRVALESLSDAAAAASGTAGAASLTVVTGAATPPMRRTS